MTDLRTDRLTLRPIGVEEAERIVSRRPAPHDSWAPDFPFEGDVVGATMFLRATAADGEQHPFGHYLVVRSSDGLAVGGIGFKGRPSDGTAEIGYGLAPSARGHGYAAEAVSALVGLARAHGCSRVIADTARANVASQRTLEHAGFTRTGVEGDLHLYALEL
ncbi:GNAT family N-acetyltransferase [Terrabacter sp. NPDC080008]|uniref:GNAT family N-acetyltransferase n=1 Tax=Terrabacter sp. NPDC080008 TaxID=3155176 RepID=UPI00344CC9C9